MQHATRHSSAIPIDAAYAQRLQCRRQWRGFLAALSQEFAQALPAQDLSLLMARVGTRFAVEHPLIASDTVDALQSAMNQVWDGMDWGLVEIVPSAGGMEVHHRFSPLAAAFGPTEADWAVGFLLGVYQQWFDAAGAGGMKVQAVAPLDSLGTAHLRLGAAAA